MAKRCTKPVLLKSVTVSWCISVRSAKIIPFSNALLLGSKSLFLSIIQLHVYYKEHTSREYGRLNELEKCLNLIYDIINKAIKVYVHDSPDKAYCSWYYDTYGDDGISNLDNYSTISYAEASYICHNCKEHDCSKCKIWGIAR